MYKKISFRSVPKPGPGNRAGFFIGRTRGTPKTPWFFEAPTPGPQTQAFSGRRLPAPETQNQQRSEENAPISERPKRKSGRPPGSRNRATIMVQNLLEGAAENIARRAAQLAEEGNVAAIRICMNRLSPLGQHNPVAFELPPIHSPQDCLRATSAILTGIASGDIAPSAALQIARLIDVHLRAISTNDLEARMTKLEKDRANSAAQDVAGGEIFR